MFTTAELFDLTQLPPELRDVLDTEYPWEVLVRLDAFALSIPAQVLGDVHPDGGAYRQRLRRNGRSSRPQRAD